MSNNGAEEAYQSAEISATSALKLPPITKTNIESWFAQIEACFKDANIPDEDEQSRFSHLVRHLDAFSVELAHEAIVHPHPRKPYTVVKGQLILQLPFILEQKKILKQVEDLELGDRTPSGLLLEMKELAAGKLSDEMLSYIFLQKLPPNIESYLMTREEKLTLLKKAEIADSFYVRRYWDYRDYRDGESSGVVAIDGASLQSVADELEMYAILDRMEKITLRPKVEMKDAVCQNSQPSERRPSLSDAGSDSPSLQNRRRKQEEKNRARCPSKTSASSRKRESGSCSEVSWKPAWNTEGSNDFEGHQSPDNFRCCPYAPCSLGCGRCKPTLDDFICNYCGIVCEGCGYLMGSEVPIFHHFNCDWVDDSYP